MNSKYLEFSVGMFLVLGLLSFALLGLKVGGLSWRGDDQGYFITAKFENIGGLTDKAPVRMAGVTIGRVMKIHLDPEDFSAVVTMKIEASNNSLPLDTSASILTSGLIGSNYIGLEAGGDYDYLQDGDEIEITQSAVVLENLIGKFLYNSAGSATTSDENN